MSLTGLKAHAKIVPLNGEGSDWIDPIHWDLTDQKSWHLAAAAAAKEKQYTKYSLFFFLCNNK